MAKKLKDYTVEDVKNTPHFELKLAKHVIIPPNKRRAKYLFSSKAKAEAYFDNEIKPIMKRGK